MRQIQHVLYLICLVWMVGACAKEDALGPFPEAPVLHSIQLSQDSIQAFTDSLYLVVEYEDANGDLGFNSADMKSLWLKDSRLEREDLYHIPPLAPLETNVHIRGKLRINLGNLFLLSNDDIEALIFTVKIRDRAGNWSDEQVSDTLFLLR